VIVGYFEDGADLVTMAMNGWGQGDPAWWLNLQANPDARVDVVDGQRLVRAHAATGEERVRLWGRWRQIDDNLDAYAALRSSETAVVVLEPQPDRDRRQSESVGVGLDRDLVLLVQGLDPSVGNQPHERD
jgi:F420H(2)-dependent quinone reductase